MNMMKLVFFFLIAPTDAVSKLGSSTSFKVARVKSGNKVSGTVYGAFPESSGNGYYVAGTDTKGTIMIIDPDDGRYVANAYANVIYS